MKGSSPSILGAVAILVLTACSDQTSVQPAATPPPSLRLRTRADGASYGHPEINDAIRRQVDSIARQIAKQLGAHSARGWLVSSMRASTSDDEHKLTLGQAHGAIQSGAARALAIRAKVSPRGAPRNFGDLDNELEVYMPVRSHRAVYAGDEPILVAWQLREDEAPIAYRPSGERVVLSLDKAPDEPVLVIVPREEEDMSQVALGTCTNAAANDVAVGTWTCNPSAMRAAALRVGPVLPPRNDHSGLRRMDGAVSACEYHPDAIIPCEDPPPPPPGGPAPQVPAAFYLGSANLFDLHEPWSRGTPEIVYLITTVPTFSNPNDTFVACVSEQPQPTQAFYLDQDSNQQNFPVSPYSVNHTYLSVEQIEDMEAIATARNMQTADVNVTVFENDRGGHCVVDKDNILGDWLAAGQALAQLYGTIKGFNTCVDETLDPSKAGTIRGAAKYFQKLSKVCGLLQTPGLVRTALQVFGGDDDWIGIGTENPSGPVNGYSHWVSNRDGFMVGQYNVTS